MEYVLSDFTKNEVQQRLESAVLAVERVPLQGFIRVPAMSVLTWFCNVEVVVETRESMGIG